MKGEVKLKNNPFSKEQLDELVDKWNSVPNVFLVTLEDSKSRNISDSKYEWRWCEGCHERIFKDEIEGETIKTINGTLYCFNCAEDILGET